MVYLFRLGVVAKWLCLCIFLCRLQLIVASYRAYGYHFMTVLNDDALEQISQNPLISLFLLSLSLPLLALLHSVVLGLSFVRVQSVLLTKTVMTNLLPVKLKPRP